VISLISGTLCVYFAVLLQRTLGNLYDARSIRAWLSNMDTFPSHPEMENLVTQFNRIKQPGNSAGRRELPNLEARFVEFDELQRQNGIASVFSAMVLEIPSSMINIALGAFLIGLAVYFGFLWTRNLDVNAGPGDSRDIFIVFIVAVFCCIGAYSVPHAIKSKDEPPAKAYGRMRSMIDSMKKSGAFVLDEDASNIHSYPPPHDIHEQQQRDPEAQLARRDAIEPAITCSHAMDNREGLNLALRRAMEAHKESSSAEKSLADEYAHMLAATEAVGAGRVKSL
jgi:hypothetical protein